MRKPPTSNYGGNVPPPTDTPTPQCGIDWLQYSVPWPSSLHSWPTNPHDVADIVSRALPPHDELRLSGEIVHPMPGYNAGMSATFGRVFWHTHRREQHIGVLFTGQDMQTAISVMLPHTAMIAWALAKGRRISRLDFALDCFAYGANPRDLLHMWKQGEVATSAHTIQELTSWTIDKAGTLVSAPTVYIGRRDSDRQMRIYDKAAQMGEHRAWVRIELQCRDQRAQSLAEAMQRKGIADAGRAALRDYCRCDELRWYTDALRGPVVALPRVGRAETNTEKWIRTVALPSIEREAIEHIQSGDWSLYDAVERALADILSKSARRRGGDDSAA